MIKPKLSSTVSVVKISDTIVEFFKTCIRQQIRIRVKDNTIWDIVNSLDGNRTIDELSEAYKVNKEDLCVLLTYLQENGILDSVIPSKDFNGYERYRRVIHFFAEYASSHENLVQMWNNVTQSTVVIIGLGAVGTWVACNLAESGVGSLILMDKDVVELTNLHRQFGYTEDTIGQYKVDVLEKRLKEYNPQISITKCYSFLDETALRQLDGVGINLIINCADKPNVDTTSLWVGEYAMHRNIPHIVGGGYNLHLSLIGQTVIPHESACIKCFQHTLEEENSVDPTRVKKLAIKNRKVGSFAPMCSIIASMVGMEALKILTKCITPSNINRRGEFDIYSMKLSYKNFEKRDDCEWCGENGKYYGSQCICEQS